MGQMATEAPLSSRSWKVNSVRVERTAGPEQARQGSKTASEASPRLRNFPPGAGLPKLVCGVARILHVQRRAVEGFVASDRASP